MKRITTLVVCIAGLLLAQPLNLAAQQSWSGPQSGQSAPQNNALQESIRTIASLQQNISAVEIAIGMMDEMTNAIEPMSLKKEGLEDRFNHMQEVVKALGTPPVAAPPTAQKTTDPRVQNALDAIGRFRSGVIAAFKSLNEKKMVAADAGGLATSSTMTFANGRSYAKAGAAFVEYSRNSTKDDLEEDIWNEVLQGCKLQFLFACDELEHRLTMSVKAGKFPTTIDELITTIKTSAWREVENRLAQAFENEKSRSLSMIASNKSQKQNEIKGLNVAMEDARVTRNSLLAAIENEHTSGYMRFGIFALVCYVIVVMTQVLWWRKCGSWWCWPWQKCPEPDTNANNEAAKTPTDNAGNKRSVPQTPPTQLDLFQSGAFVQVFALVVVMLTIGIIGANQKLQWENVGTMLGTIVGYAFGRATQPR